VFYALDIVRVADTQRVPAVGHETGSDVFCECDFRTAFDGDAVVVVYPAQIVEFKVARERRPSEPIPSIKHPSPQTA
jgi:hypothetical protein